MHGEESSSGQFGKTNMKDYSHVLEQMKKL